jgi:hypothetical protein
MTVLFGAGAEFTTQESLGADQQNAVPTRTAIATRDTVMGFDLGNHRYYASGAGCQTLEPGRVLLAVTGDSPQHG